MAIGVDHVLVERGALRLGRSDERVRIDAELGQAVAPLPEASDVALRHEGGELAGHTADERRPLFGAGAIDRRASARHGDRPRVGATAVSRIVGGAPAAVGAVTTESAV